MSKRQPYSPLEKHSRTQPTLVGQPKYSPQRRYSYERGYRFEFRQPFHLDAVKQLFFPAFTQYLEERKEERAVVPRKGNPVELPFEPPATDHHPAYTLPGHFEGNVGKGKAPVPPSVKDRPRVAETLGSSDSELRVLTSGKPSDSIGGNMNPETDNSDVTIRPEKDQALEELQPKPATRQHMGSSSILARPGPEKDRPIGTRKSEERQLAALRFPMQTKEKDIPESSKTFAAREPSIPNIDIELVPITQDLQQESKSPVERDIRSNSGASASRADYSRTQDATATPEIQTHISKRRWHSYAPGQVHSDRPHTAGGRYHLRPLLGPERFRNWVTGWRQQRRDPRPALAARSKKRESGVEFHPESGLMTDTDITNETDADRTFGEASLSSGLRTTLGSSLLAAPQRENHHIPLLDSR